MSYFDLWPVQEILKPRLTRGATYILAASNSSLQSQAQADDVCDGTNDNENIQNTIDALPS